MLRLLALLLVLPTAVLAAIPANPKLKDTAGIQIGAFFNQFEQLEEMADVGFTRVRMDFDWAWTEPERGEYDFSRYDMVMKRMDKLDLNPLFILYRPGPHYVSMTETVIGGVSRTMLAAPTSEEAITAYSLWASKAAARYKGRNVIWEIWNEPDHPQFWRPKPNAHDYIRLATAACGAIRMADRDAVVIGPASATFTHRFLERPPFLWQVLKSPLPGCVDAISAHPYRLSEAPETVIKHADWVRYYIKKYTPFGAKDVIFSEWGYSTNDDGPVSEARQARWLPRMLLTNMAAHIPLTVIYQWQDKGVSASDREMHFGIKRVDGTQKPAYHTIKVLLRELGDYRLVKSLLPLPKDNDADAPMALLFRKDDGSLKIAAWMGGKKNVPLHLALPGWTASGDVIGSTGQTRDLPTQKDDKGLRIKFMPDVQYIPVTCLRGNTTAKACGPVPNPDDGKRDAEKPTDKK